MTVHHLTVAKRGGEETVWQIVPHVNDASVGSAGKVLLASSEILQTVLQSQLSGI